MPKVDVRKNEPTIPALGAAEFQYKVSIVTDDRSTDVEIETDEGVIVGRGFARRRKGDRRSDDLGVALALGRAFEDVSNGYADLAEGMLNGKLPK